MATHTPWGDSQSSQKLAPGIITYSTAGHGGIHLSPSLNAQVAECWRRKDGWYEEDLDWAIVAFHFPDVFSKDLAYAKGVLRDWYPDEYQQVTGETLTPETSLKLRDRAFREATKDKLVALAAFGATGAPNSAIPTGMVGVIACRGGLLENFQYASKEMRYFLVDVTEYRTSSPGFVIDESRHVEVPSFHSRD